MTVSQKTLKLLAAETGNDPEDADVSGNQVDFGGSDHFMVFPSYDAAERYAKQYLIELVEESPEYINSDMLNYYLTMRPGDVRAFASDAADHAYENAEYNEEDATEAYEDEYDRVEAALKDDPIGYFDDMGYSPANAYSQGWLVLDTDALVRDALINDGVQGIIGASDLIELENGAEAYTI